METEKMIRMMVEKVLKEISMKEKESLKKNGTEDTGKAEAVEKTENPRLSAITVFLGNDEILKDQLRKEMEVEDRVQMSSTWNGVMGSYLRRKIKRLVVSELCINNLVNLAQGRKNIITEFLFNGGEVFIVEEGLEYRKYNSPSQLIRIYDEYFEKIKKFGIKAVKRENTVKILAIKEELQIQGVITVDKLSRLNMKDHKIVVGGKTLITAAARDYARENNIEIYYERGQ